MRAILCALSATILSADPLAAAHAPAAVFRGGSSSCPPPVRVVRQAPQRCAPVVVQQPCNQPANTVWIPGAWRQQACGWVYVPGYWAPCRPEPRCRSTISVTWRW